MKRARNPLVILTMRGRDGKTIRAEAQLTDWTFTNLEDSRGVPDPFYLLAIWVGYQNGAYTWSPFIEHD